MPTLFERPEGRAAMNFYGFRSGINSDCRKLNFYLRCSLLLVIVLIAATCPSMLAQSQEELPSSDAARTVSTVLYEIQPNHFEARIDLGALDINSKNRFELHIQNDSGQRILLPDPTVTCGCLSVELPAKKVEPGEVLKMGVELQAPPNPKAEQFVQFISFSEIEEGQSRLRVRLQSKLRGVLAFPQDSHLVKISSDILKARETTLTRVVIPFVFSDPVKATAIAVELSPSLDHVFAEVSSVDSGKASIVVSIDYSKVKTEGLLLVVTASDPVTAKSAQCSLTVVPVSEMELIPSIVRLGVNEDQTVSGKAMLLVRPGEAVEDAPFVEVRCGDIGFRTALTPVGRAGFRVAIASSNLDDLRRQMESGNNSLTWSVVRGKSKMTFSSPFLLLSGE